MFTADGVTERFGYNSDIIESTDKEFDYQTPWYKQLGANTTIQEMVIFMKDRANQEPYPQDELVGDLELIEVLTREVLK